MGSLCFWEEKWINYSFIDFIYPFGIIYSLKNFLKKYKIKNIIILYILIIFFYFINID